MKKWSLFLCAALLATASCQSEKKDGDAPFDFSTARGLNLIDLSNPGWYPPGKLREEDFRMLKENGFNHVRITVGYKMFTNEEEPGKIDEEKATEIDDGLQLSKKYGIHATLCLFAVPGYAVYEKDQKPSLWTDEGLQKIFTEYWKSFAKRYRDIPPSELSFNLINEPPNDISEETYASLMRRAIHAIHAVDPDRQIVIDGLDSGRRPVMSLADEPHTIQSAHYYEPFELSHYQASWIGDADQFPAANVWPLPIIPHHFFGPEKETHSPLVIKGDFSQFRSLTIALEMVLIRPEDTMVLKLTTDSGKTAAAEVLAQPSWKHLQEYGEGNLVEYMADTSVEISIPEGASSITLEMTNGDRLTFREVRFNGDTPVTLQPTTRRFIAQPGTIIFTPDKGFSSTAMYDRKWIATDLRAAWDPLIKRGVPVVVQEFGCNFLLPHDTARSYISDCRAAFEDVGIGWCYFSNTGTLGIFDSKRLDSPLLELPDGRKMDSKMFESLSTGTQ